MNARTSGSVAKMPCAPIAEYLLDVACLKSPVIRKTIASFGDSTLSEYLQSTARAANDSFQGRNDFLDAVHRYVAPLLNDVAAERVCNELDDCPIVLTTNHHGVDFFAQSVQGSLMFSLRTINGAHARTVPVLACAGIPLDNLTYPQGLLLYHVGQGKLDSMPRKLPILSNRLRRQTVSVAAPIEEIMIVRAQQRAAKMVLKNEICASLSGALQQLLAEDYGSPTVIELSTYSDQAVVLNHRIWKRLFEHPEHAPDLVYLELEKIATALLKSDLLNPDSLTSCTILDSQCRGELLEELDGVSACWERSKLMGRVSGQRRDNNNAISKWCGTMFFWGINDMHRKVPLCLVKCAAGEMLRGIDGRGRPFEHPFNPQSLIDGLRTKKLLPSLFTCFLTLSLARGVTCLGGYYQAGYLPRIQRGVVDTLRRRGGYHDAADRVTQVHTEGYLGGMQAVMLRLQGHRTGPAGPVEIIARGGLTSRDLEQIRRCTVRDAHIASLFETIPDLGLSHVGPANWKSKLALDCDRQLSGRVVCKSLDAPDKAREEDDPSGAHRRREMTLSV